MLKIMGNKLIILYLLLLALSACKQETSLEKILKMSGENRIHLAKVLEHYSYLPEDSLKYKTACFLIENMPGHGWYEGDELTAYKKWVDSVYADQNFVFRATLYEAFFQQPNATEGLTWKEDVEHIDSSFLISHIDFIFQRIKRCPWLETLTFNQLCEYVFPYRVGYEPPQLFFELQDSLYQAEIEELLNYDDIKTDPVRIFNVKSPFRMTSLTVPLLYKGRYIDYEIANCASLAIAKKWRGRLLLCPVTFDIVPAYADRSGHHRWAVMINNNQVNGYTQLTSAISGKGKVYRHTFSHQAYPCDTLEYVPPFFRSPFYMDVTSDYNQVRDVIINVPDSIDNRYVYLCVFNNLHWAPVALSKNNDGNCCFKNVGCGVVYIPAIYNGRRMQTFSFPFLLDLQGKFSYFQPDVTVQTTLRLERKYPLKYSTRISNQRFLSAKLECSNTSDFRSYICAGSFDSISYHQESWTDVKIQEPYRYWRIHAKDSFAIGEYILLDMNRARIFPDDQKQNLITNCSNAFDNKPLPYVYSDKSGMLTIDMGKKVTLSKVECLLRNDGNFIYPGHWYELNYFDGIEWCSLGIKEAKGDYVEFAGIPSNALLWLRDLTEGKEERIFTYNDGRISFW